MRLNEIRDYRKDGLLHLEGWGEDDTSLIHTIAKEYGFEVLQAENPTILDVNKYDPIAEIFTTHLRKDLGVNFENLS